MIGINNDADDSLGFHQFGGERMTIRNANVGIGTTTPTDKLRIRGTARVPGNPSALSIVVDSAEAVES